MEKLLQALIGTWFITSTNFPMWLKGDKTSPTFNYSAVAGKPNVLLDEVRYQKKGRTRTITGFDHQDETDPTTFVWRGKGLLSPLRSRWKVTLLDSAGQWAVIWFSKTLFTPEGVDIISRAPVIDTHTLQTIKERMQQDATLKKHLGSLKSLSIE